MHLPPNTAMSDCISISPTNIMWINKIPLIWNNILKSFVLLFNCSSVFANTSDRICTSRHSVWSKIGVSFYCIALSSALFRELEMLNAVKYKKLHFLANVCCHTTPKCTIHIPFQHECVLILHFPWIIASCQCVCAQLFELLPQAITVSHYYYYYYYYHADWFLLLLLCCSLCQTANTYISIGIFASVVRYLFL